MYISVIAHFTWRVSQLEKNSSVRSRCTRSRRKQVHDRAVAAGELIFRFILVRSNLQSIRAAPPWQRNAKNEARRFSRSRSQPESKEHFVDAVLVCTSTHLFWFVTYLWTSRAVRAEAILGCSAQTQLISIGSGSSNTQYTYSIENNVIYFNEPVLANTIIRRSHTCFARELAKYFRCKYHSCSLNATDLTFKTLHNCRWVISCEIRDLLAEFELKSFKFYNIPQYFFAENLHLFEIWSGIQWCYWLQI